MISNETTISTRDQRTQTNETVFIQISILSEQIQTETSAIYATFYMISNK